MFKKKNNIYNSYEDDITDIASKEKELINTYESDNYKEEDVDEVIELEEDDEDEEEEKLEEKKKKKSKKNIFRKKKKHHDEVDDEIEITEIDDDNIKEDNDLIEKTKIEKDEIIVDENLSDEEYEEFSLEEDDDYDYLEKRNKRIHIFIRILNIIFIIIILAMIMIATDVVCVARYNIGPFFAIPVKTYDDGGTKVYYGIGYKVIKYNQIQGRRDKVIGLWTLKYDTNPTTVQALDLAIEFNDNETETYEKYYKKFVRVISTLEKVNEKNNTITISYVDEGKKYSLDIVCKMASKNSGIKDLRVGEEITVIGTVTKYDFESKTKVGKLHISDCFAEQ